MGIILFATAGRTDLQILIKDKDGKIYRTNFDSNGLREVHQALLDKKLSYVIKSSEDYPEHPKRPFVKFEREQLNCGDFELYMEGGKYVIVPEKLRAVVKSIKDSRDTIWGAVVFSTKRDDPALYQEKIYKEEPIACGHLLGEWLSRELKLSFSTETEINIEQNVPFGVTYIDILTDKMMSPGEDRDYPVNREAMQLVNDTMKVLSKNYPNTEAWLSVGGGLPELKEPIKECALYFFENRITYWHTPQHSPKSTSDNYIKLEPNKEHTSIQESFQCRNNARALILKGDFIGAYSALQHIRDEKEKIWINKIGNIARYFMGNLENEENASELKLLLKPNNKKPPRCLLVGMRCEAALQAKRYPEAIAWTCTFADTALMDMIERKEFCQELDDLKRRIIVKNKVNIPSELTKPLSNNYTKGKACLNISEDKQYYKYETSGGFKDIWLQVIDKPFLKNYLKALRTKIEGYEPLDLRNLTMHSILNQKLVDKVYNVFHKAGLWASEEEAKNRENLFFLNNHLSEGILKSFNLKPVKLYKEIIVGNLLKELDNYEIQ